MRKVIMIDGNRPWPRYVIEKVWSWGHEGQLLEILPPLDEVDKEAIYLIRGAKSLPGSFEQMKALFNVGVRVVAVVGGGTEYPFIDALSHGAQEFIDSGLMDLTRLKLYLEKVEFEDSFSSAGSVT